MITTPAMAARCTPADFETRLRHRVRRYEDE